MGAMELGLAAIEFDKSVPLQHRRIIENDLKNLCQLNYDLQGEKIDRAKRRATEIFEIEDLDCDQLKDWLFDRIKLIVGNLSFQELEERIIIQKNNQLKTPSLVDRIFGPFNRFFDMLTVNFLLNMAYAANLGSLIYGATRDVETREMYIYPFRDDDNYFKYIGDDGSESLLPVTTPRVGIILLTEHFFSHRSRPTRSTAQSMANSLFRISNLIHEARHSDGHGDYATFPHVSCSGGSEQSLFKFFASGNCDNAFNGPYGLSADFLDYAVLACDDCTIVEKLRLTRMSYQMKKKIIRGSGVVDATPIPE